MLDDLKMMLGIAAGDTSLNDKLNWIISATKSRLQMLLGGAEVPEQMNYIITEVSVARFNRIGSEGMTSQSVEGETLNFGSNDFNAYMDEIKAYLDGESALEKKGGFKFL